MTDMKKLMIDVDPKAGQRLSLESLAEAAETEPLDISPADCMTITRPRRIRASKPFMHLLAYFCDQGILLKERRSGLQYLLTVEQIREALFAKEG